MGFKLPNLGGVVNAPFQALGLGGNNIKDTLFGEQGAGISASPIAADIFATNKKALDLQRAGLDKFDALSKQSGADIVQNQLEKEKNFAIQGAIDARRKIQEMAARRGLQRSTIPGIQENAVNTDLANTFGGIEAKRPEMIRNFDIQNAGLAFNPAIQVSQANPMNVPLQNLPGGPRQGGLLGAVGPAMQATAGVMKFL